MWELYSMLLKARQLAIIKQEEHQIFFNVETKSYKLKHNEEIIKTNKLSAGIDFNNISFGDSNLVTFTPLGTARSGHVEIENSYSNHYKIIVSPHTGRVRYEKD